MKYPNRFIKGIIFTLSVLYIKTVVIGILSISGNIPNSTEKLTKRKRIIIGNWKSLGNRHTISSFIHSSINSDEFKEISTRVDIVVAPPMINVQMFQSAPVILASQDISRYPQKEESPVVPMTGETPPSLLIDNKIKMVLIGHSEQRMTGISDSAISDKLRNALSNGLGVIYCVGHIYNEGNEINNYNNNSNNNEINNNYDNNNNEITNNYDNNNSIIDSIPNNYFSMGEDQPWVSLINQMGLLCDTISDMIINNNLNNNNNNNKIHKHKIIHNLNEKDKLLISDKIIIAYEPSSAIGKNIKIINKEEIKDIIISIKSFMRGCGLNENVIRVIYGGGVDENNCKDLKEIELLDGLIVGRSALEFDRFIHILRCLEKE